MHRTLRCATLDPYEPAIATRDLLETCDEQGVRGGRHMSMVENTTTCREAQGSQGEGRIAIHEQGAAVGVRGNGSIWHGVA